MFGAPKVSDVVKAGMSKNLEHSNFHFKVGYVDPEGKHRIYNWDSIIDKYRDVLLQHTYKVTMSDLEYEKYRLQPRMFCYDFYMNADLWSVLLRLNNMLTATDFDRRTFIAFGPKFVDVLNEILSIEDDYLNASLLNAKISSN